MIEFLQTPRLYVGFPRTRFSVLYFSLFMSMIFFSPLNILHLSYLLTKQIYFFERAAYSNFVNQALRLVSSWFRANKITVHPDKSKLTLFHPQRKTFDLSRFNIFFYYDKS